MTIHEIKNILLWCVVLNYLVLFIWFGLFIFVHDSMYQLHSRWFKISVEFFDSIHYAGMAVYKVGILLFALVPLLALCLVQ